MVSLIDLYSRVGYDVEFVVDLFDGFVEDARDIAAELRTAIEADDMSAVAAAAHNIKGASQNLAVDALAQYSRDIEKAARTNKLSAVKELTDKLVAGIDELEAFIKEEGWAVLSEEDQAKIPY